MHKSGKSARRRFGLGARTNQRRAIAPKRSCWSLVGLLAALVVGTATAAPVYQPPGSSLTYGDVVHNQRLQSGTTNPAAAAADLWRSRETGTDAQSGIVGSMVFGIEYGNLDKFYERVDEIADSIKRRAARQTRRAEPRRHHRDLLPGPCGSHRQARAGGR
jgi:hypothetical protein